MESIITVFIYIHAGLGGIALLSGLVSLIVKKGNNTHKKAGVLFYYTMLSSAVSAMIIAFLPNHESPFLFAIGIFSSYFIITGYRALHFKKNNPNLKIDKLISSIMLFTSIGMIIYALINYPIINIVLLVFGVIGFIFSLINLRLYTYPEKLKSKWLKLHLGNMIGGYISAATAFVVVNQFFPSFYGWFIPGIAGGIYIAYWIRKINEKYKNKLHSNPIDTSK
ncbi:DUF2306 domain-containing protein [uncultured Aquimarina sp.]|jgi:uncharacterized membrane protein|uniref:DUF2306 domain-containing protein n=1 Tax=uncultured Aquimarina sp. TaxID=575652 RepID=UPI00261B0558|nr:DUF2306 domain-containing protein [uncultured Aquimarina sp.]